MRPLAVVVLVSASASNEGGRLDVSHARTRDGLPSRLRAGRRVLQNVMEKEGVVNDPILTSVRSPLDNVPQDVLEVSDDPNLSSGRWWYTPTARPWTGTYSKDLPRPSFTDHLIDPFADHLTELDHFEIMTRGTHRNYGRGILKPGPIHSTLPLEPVTFPPVPKTDTYTRFNPRWWEERPYLWWMNPKLGFLSKADDGVKKPYPYV
ncbi:MAG: hypothetical protein KVP17_004156 [Porospora cf. gigantea B]|uniref:uncharacterized protein n=1 Tax=Porospora cf. gigantea B TaxID=2853592 RepID=UPI0035717ADB|nr:MAG: hypothetical protein KVP17_004156 [Porospora cf. gigantea B]